MTDESIISREGEVKLGAPVLVAARPDRMRDSLQILLKMVNEINVVGHADDSYSAVRMVSKHRPALLLLDTNLPGEEISTVLEQIRANGSQSRCLVLVDSVQQRQEAESAGADAALVKGFPAAKLFEVIKGLLSEQKALVSTRHE